MTDRLIYAALVAVWLAYLIPMGIRRYREVSAHGSMKSFSSSMKALGRSPSASATAPGGTPAGRTVAARPAEPQPAVAGVLDRPSAREAASRRRRTLVLLLGLVAVTGVLVALTSLLWPALLVPIALVVAFLVVCRIQVARLEEAAWARAAEAARRSAVSTPASAPVRFGGCDEETVVISGPAAARLASVLADVPAGASPVVVQRSTAAPVPEVQPAVAVAHGAHQASPVGSQPVVAHGAHPASPLQSQPAVATPHGAHPAVAHGAHPASPLQPQPAVAAAHGAHPAHAAAVRPADIPGHGGLSAPPVAQPAAPATWDLRPVTLPTYITKSRAPRTVRSVDRSGSSSWSSGRNSGARTVHDEAADKPVEKRRAVSG